MGILTHDMKRIVTEQRLGFVASVDADGTPNLSPKGTMVVIDDDHIAFGEIRSPGTVRNLQAGSTSIEINFIDPFVRKGYRFKGKTTIVPRGSDEFGLIFPAFAHWDKLAEKIRAIVKLKVERALPLSSPAYDIGATEPELRRAWTRNFRELQPNKTFTEN